MSRVALHAAPSRRPSFDPAELETRGYALDRGVFTATDCAALAALFDDEASRFRSRVVMQRHQYGRGEYRYFDYPLPALIGALRESLYDALLPAARALAAALGGAADLPATHAAFIERCHAAGQGRPTPLLLRYGRGDYNRLHQDRYGEVQFPFQAMVLLSQPGSDFAGGEFCLSFQRFRAQSRIEVVPVRQGDLVVFPVDTVTIGDGPAAKPRRERARHGVSRIHRGSRSALGIPLHDAR